MSDEAAKFLAVLVLLALFIGWCYMSYRVAVWVFKRGVRKDLEAQVRREMIERGELPPDDKEQHSIF